jgi:hypothetical protein
VTPVITWEGKGLGKFTPGNAADAVKDSETNELFDSWMTGDARCAPER